MTKPPKTPRIIAVDALRHEGERRVNIPTAEFESIMDEADKAPVRLAYERRNRDLDPQLVWRGKDAQDEAPLIVNAPPIYVQEKVHPKVLIEDLKRLSAAGRAADGASAGGGGQFDLFADFNGLKDKEAATEFYAHDQNWTNRMIAGDSLQVMASLAEREGLRGKVQCIYFDPPYGIKFNSNFQWSTTSRDVKDGARDHVTREPEQVRAFRDTWRDGIHSYLSYLRDRLTVARDLLTDSGSIFVQIGDENVHRVRALMDEVFGEGNIISQIAYQTTPYATSDFLAPVYDIILWYGKNYHQAKYRPLYKDKADLQSFSRFSTAVSPDRCFTRPRTKQEADTGEMAEGWKLFQPVSLVSPGPTSSEQRFAVAGKVFLPPSNSHWKTRVEGLGRAYRAGRIHLTSSGVRFRSYVDDFSISVTHNIWTDTSGGISSRTDEKRYVVQTSPTVIERCILMTTDPGDLVLDPTCGSGTTAMVSEQWGRRWITIDTSRVAIALARSRLMGSRYPWYLLTDSLEGQRKLGEVTGVPLRETVTRGDLRLGFVYERVPHITLKSVATNTEIDVIWERMQPAVEAARAALNAALAGHGTPFKVETGGRAGKTIDFTATGTVTLPSGEEAPAAGFMEWEIPREAPSHWPPATHPLLTAFWDARIARQKAIDASIAARAEFENLYDRPYVDSGKVRVAGPFTVESLSPHRTLAVDWDDSLIDILEASEGKRAPDGRLQANDFVEMILEQLRRAGVQQTAREDRISFSSLVPWPGRFICAEGRYEEGGIERRAGILIGPEFGILARPDLIAAAREAGDAGFDVVIACAFNYDAHASELERLGRVPILKARMNPDLHMGGELKATGAGNLFVVFGEPDIRVEELPDGQIQVQVFGVDVFKPQTGEVQSEGTDGIALWMLDTDYNEESFFVRHAYFLGAGDPYKALKTSLKAEIDEEAWGTLNSDTSRPFPKPSSGRIAVKVINHLGDEVMKVFRV